MKKDPAAVIFVPRTNGGTLARMMKDGEMSLDKIMSRKVKIVEKPGSKLKDILVKKDPWSGRGCGRSRCKMCEQEGESKEECKLRGVIYYNDCMDCKGRRERETSICR